MSSVFSRRAILAGAVAVFGSSIAAAEDNDLVSRVGRTLKRLDAPPPDPPKVSPSLPIATEGQYFDPKLLPPLESPVDFPVPPVDVQGLIEAIVSWQVCEYNERLQQSEVLKYLTQEEVENKTVTFVAGESLYQVMQANFDLVDQDGFITSINGQAQDEAAQKYWMYDVNGEMALVGAKDLILEPGDHVEFKLEEMK